jgi:hypothetical protein
MVDGPGLYTYVRNKPSVLSDPTGHLSWLEQKLDSLVNPENPALRGVTDALAARGAAMVDGLGAVRDKVAEEGISAIPEIAATAAVGFVTAPVQSAVSAGSHFVKASQAAWHLDTKGMAEHLTHGVLDTADAISGGAGVKASATKLGQAYVKRFGIPVPGLAAGGLGGGHIRPRPKSTVPSVASTAESAGEGASRTARGGKSSTGTASRQKSATKAASSTRSPDATNTGDPGVRAFAHGTSPESAKQIVSGGLNEKAARAASHGGRLNQPGHFHTHEVGPPSNPGEGMQLAYEWGHRASPTPVVLIMELPEDLVKRLQSKGLLTTEQFSGMPLPQHTFSPGSYATVNKAARWQILRPPVRR